MNLIGNMGVSDNQTMIQNIRQNQLKIFFIPELSRRMENTMKKINLAESGQISQEVQWGKNN